MAKSKLKTGMIVKGPSVEIGGMGKLNPTNRKFMVRIYSDGIAFYKGSGKGGPIAKYPEHVVDTWLDQKNMTIVGRKENSLWGAAGMWESKGMNEGYKIHYPSLKNLTKLQYTDPRTSTDGRTVCAEKAGNFRHGDANIGGHYIVYEDSNMPNTYIGIHVSSDINEDTGESQISVVAMDSSKSAVMGRVKYRMRQSKIAEGDSNTPLTGDDMRLVKDFSKQIGMTFENVAKDRKLVNKVLPKLQEKNMQAATEIWAIHEGWERTKTDGIQMEAGRKPSKEAKQAWMKKYEELATAKNSKLKGNVDWDTATHLFNIGKTPEQATK
jgi:hypothetical protein